MSKNWNKLSWLVSHKLCFYSFLSQPLNGNFVSPTSITIAAWQLKFNCRLRSEEKENLLDQFKASYCKCHSFLPFFKMTAWPLLSFILLTSTSWPTILDSVSNTTVPLPEILSRSPFQLLSPKLMMMRKCWFSWLRIKENTRRSVCTSFNTPSTRALAFLLSPTSSLYLL